MSKVRQVFLHIIIWLILLLLFVYTSKSSNSFHNASTIFIYSGIFNITLFYINYLYVLPKYLHSRNYFTCAISIITLILLSGCIKYGLVRFFNDANFVGRQQAQHMSFWNYYLASVFASTFFIFISTGFKFSADWFINEKVKKSLEKEKLAAELAFLKSQINPHFLFNSLNNIYSLAYQRSEKTPEAVLKLSEIMRYMLQESNETKVQLVKEIQYLNNFIELQKLRFKNEAYVKVEISGEQAEHKVAPLILIAFVENAFKHGITSDPENPITIILKINDTKLYFEVCNKKSQMNKDLTSGIGLTNVKRRLQLLYPGKHKLYITQNELTYSSKLSLDL